MAPSEIPPPHTTPPPGDGHAGGAPPPPADGPPPADAKEMSFLDHLEDLRWTLFKGFGAVALTTLICAFFSEWIIDEVLLGPTREDFFLYRLYGMDAKSLVLQNRTITGQFFAHIGTVAAVGAVMGSPLFVFFLWKFIEPGLYPEEKQGMRFAAVTAAFAFLCGILFAYGAITPLALQFFASYVISDQIVNEFDITKYFQMVTVWAFGIGLLFELPVVVYFLAKLGLATPDRLRAWRKYVIVIVLVLAAIFTPPDPVSQILVAIPLLLLYELSILVAGRVQRSERRRAERAAKKAAQAQARGK